MKNTTGAACNCRIDSARRCSARGLPRSESARPSRDPSRSDPLAHSLTHPPTHSLIHPSACGVVCTCRIDSESRRPAHHMLRGESARLSRTASKPTHSSPSRVACNRSIDSEQRPSIRRRPRSESARPSRDPSRPDPLTYSLTDLVIHQHEGLCKSAETTRDDAAAQSAVYPAASRQGHAALPPDPPTHQHEGSSAYAASIQNDAVQFAVYLVASQQGPATIHPGPIRSPTHSPTHSSTSIQDRVQLQKRLGKTPPPSPPYSPQRVRKARPHCAETHPLVSLRGRLQLQDQFSTALLSSSSTP